MDRERILTRLQQLTGNLKPSERSTTGDLHSLQKNLAEHLIRDADFSVFGERLHHEGVGHLETAREASLDRFPHLGPLLQSSSSVDDQAAPLVFRRSTAFQNNLVGNSVPVWGSGMAASKSYGPFLDENDLLVWFDFYQPTRMISVCFKGSSTPVLLIPVWGTIAPKKNYKIEAGSVWIASSLIVNNSSLSGYYTGLKIRGGSLELSAKSEVDAGKIVIKPGINATLQLELDQNVVSGSSADAGFDATAAEVKLPETCTLKFNTSTGHLTAANASCTVFGTEAQFSFLNTTPVWIAPIAQILIPYSVKTTGASPDVFTIRSSDSLLCNLDKRAKIGPASGWLLPATKIDPQQLGQAAGTGALCIGLGKGISTTWKGLTDSKTRLVQPAIITEPGMVTVADFFAENTRGKVKWTLWKNAATKHHSDITLGFGKAFPFIYISSTAGSEAVLFFCKHKASFDRPVDANNSPFVIESSIALASIAQSGTSFRASLFDNDLLFDGNSNQPKAFEICSIVLRNAFFSVSRPYSLFLTGKLTADNEVSAGMVVLLFSINRYLPTLPDPYVASYTTTKRSSGGREFGSFGMGLAGFVKWPNPSEASVAEDGTIENPAYVYFKFAPYDQSLLLGQAAAISNIETDAAPDVRNFQTGVGAFNRNVVSDVAIERATLPAIAHEQSLSDKTPPLSNDFTDRISSAVQSGEMQSAIVDLEANPALKHIKDKAALIDRVLSTAAADAEFSSAIAENPDRAFSFAAAETPGRMATNPQGGGLMFTQDAFMLLDVSSNADQMGVSWGTSIEVGRNSRGDTNLRTVNATMAALVPGGTQMPLQILNMDVVGIGRNLRAITLPQISWEPISNIPLEVEGGVAFDDTITVAPGLVVYQNDGIPTRIGSESPYPVPIAPIPVTRHFVKEFNDDVNPRQLQSVFTLPFAMIAQADFDRTLGGDPKDNARISLNRPYFEKLRGGLQIKSLAPQAPTKDQSPAFTGWTLQLDESTTGVLFGVPLTGLLRWVFFGFPITGSTLGKTVKKIFNQEFASGGNKPKVPVERMEFSGYGASIFSNWLDSGAAIAEVSQTLFDVLVGRTAHEVVQVRSILYPWGVHVVRTITLMRSANGYVFRSDSGWRAESDGFFDFTYKINFEAKAFPDQQVLNSYEVHHDIVKGISNVREIKDYAAASPFTSSFTLDDPTLSTELLALTLPQWKDLYKGKTILDKKFKLDVEMQAVVFDADVHLDNVTSGGVKDPVYKDFKVQSRKMLGYVQLAPAAVLVPSRVFAELLDFQNGTLGGPVDCLIDVAKSEQKMRLSRADVSAAKDGIKNIFVSAARGSLILPPDGSWSVVKQQTNTKDVKVLEEGQSVPLIKRTGFDLHRIAEPKDIVQAATNSSFGVVQSTGTQKLLFDMPRFSPGVKKLKSAQTYFADAYKLLNSKGVFPNVANALALTNAEREVEILGEGLMRMPTHDINVASLMPSNFSYAFVNEPGILKIYAEYTSTGGAQGNLNLGIDSLGAAADKWKAALSNIIVVVDLGPFERLMWVDGNFNASSGVNAKYDKPNLQFGPVLKTVKDILQILATLSGDDFDDGMKVGMSNSADSWEYKFNCSQEIPVIKFPSPTELAVNPNPPLKLEAGLKVGFYFNEVIAIPTDLKQLVPACGAYVGFYGRIQVMCFTLGAASIYAVGQVDLGIAADSKAGISLRMKFGFGVEIVVGLPVVGNVSVLYMVEIEVGIDSASVTVGAFMLFRGHAEICGGLVGVTIQIEAGGSVKRTGSETNCIAQVTFSIDIQILWVIDISFSDTWQESRQIS